MADFITKVIKASDPTANDDIDDGYSKGSLWINSTSGDRWVCTVNTATSAVWEKSNFEFIDDDTFGTASATSVASSESIKAYVDGLVSTPLNYKGGYNASTNTPDLDVSPTGVSLGDMYTVTAAGAFFTENVQIGDVLIAEVDSAAALGDWTIVEANQQPASETVAGYVRLATIAETNTGTDNTIAVTPDGLDGWTGSAQVVTVGTLSAGSITTTFGNINIGSSTISATGTWTGPSGTWSATGIDLAVGDAYSINGTSVLNSTTLGSTVVTSSLTTVGALTSGSIATGFGSINIGANTISATGTWTGPSGTWDSGGIDLATGDSFAINASDVLTSTTLGTTVVNSSLTSVGELTNLTMANGGQIRTTTTTANTFTLAAYDTDLTGYVDFITFTSGTVPTCALASDVTAVTQTQADNSTKIATTAYVDTAVSGASGDPNFVGEDTGATPSATGTDSIAMGPASTASGIQSVAMGANSEATLYGQVGLPRVASNGTTSTESHISMYGWGGSVSSTTLTELFLGGVASNRLSIPTNSAYAFTVTIVGFSQTGASAVGYKFEGMIYRLAGNVAFATAPTQTILGETADGFQASVEADTTNNALVVKARLDTGTTETDFAAFGSVVRIR